MSELPSNTVPGGDRQSPMASLQIEVIADLICPFCFVGKRRFDEALKAVQGPSSVVWYPYQLDPELPAGGLTLDAYVNSKFGSAERIEPALEYLKVEGRGVGIEFRFDKIDRVPSTRVLHQLMQAAESLGKDQSALAEDLMSAFFEHGIDIGDLDAVTAIAARHGISSAEVADAVGSEELRRVVVAREQQVRNSGISGVPGFLVNRRLLVVGAQQADQIVNAFDRAMFGEDSDPSVLPVVH